MTATPTALKDSKIYSEIARRGLTQRCRPFSPDVMALYTTTKLLYANPGWYTGTGDFRGYRF